MSLTFQPGIRHHRIQELEYPRPSRENSALNIRASLRLATQAVGHLLPSPR